MTAEKNSKKSPERERAWVEIEGHELLKSPAQIRGSDQARLVARAAKLFADTDEAEGALGVDLEDFADFADWVVDRFAVDPEKFDSWASGSGGLERTLELMTAYAAEVGKLSGSETSSTGPRS